MGGWDAAIWDDFSSWTCPFPGPAHFPHLLSPNSPSLMHFRATRCIYVYCQTGVLSWVDGDAFSVYIVEHHFLPLVFSDLFCYLL